MLLAGARRGAHDPTALPPLTAHTERTITDPGLLRAELGLVRSRGYALNDGESAHGVRTVAVPVRNAEGLAHAALALRSTPDLLTDTRLPPYLARAQECARALETLLLPPEERYRHTAEG